MYKTARRAAHLARRRTCKCQLCRCVGAILGYKRGVTGRQFNYFTQIQRDIRHALRITRPVGLHRHFERIETEGGSGAHV